MPYFSINIHKESGIDGFISRDQWLDCPFALVRSLSYEIIKSLSSTFFEYAKTVLDLGYYVYVIINTRYIPNYTNGTSDDDHNLFVCGYDLEKQSVYILDFYQHGKLTLESCSIADLNIAFENYVMVPHHQMDAESYVVKYQESVCYTYNRDFFKKQINTFLNSDNLFKTYWNGLTRLNDFEYQKFSFGLEYYDTLSELTQREDFYRFRPFYLLYEQAVLMQRRIRYLGERQWLANRIMLEQQAQNLIESCLCVQNLFIKGSLTPKGAWRDKVCEQLVAMIENLFEQIPASNRACESHMRRSGCYG